MLYVPHAVTLRHRAFCLGVYLRVSCDSDGSRVVISVYRIYRLAFRQWTKHLFPVRSGLNFELQSSKGNPLPWAVQVLRIVLFTEKHSGGIYID